LERQKSRQLLLTAARIINHHKPKIEVALNSAVVVVVVYTSCISTHKVEKVKTTKVTNRKAMKNSPKELLFSLLDENNLSEQKIVVFSTARKSEKCLS
jgi:hypothetical protein